MDSSIASIPSDSLAPGVGAELAVVFCDCVFGDRRSISAREDCRDIDVKVVIVSKFDRDRVP